MQASLTVPCLPPCPALPWLQALSEESARLSMQQEQLASQQMQVTAAALRASNGGVSPSAAAAAAVAARAASLAARETQLLQQQQELTERERDLAQVGTVPRHAMAKVQHGICMPPASAAPYHTLCSMCADGVAPAPAAVPAPQRSAELQSARSNVAASADAEQSRLLGLVSAQAAALADKERQLEVSTPAGSCRGLWGP